MSHVQIRGKDAFFRHATANDLLVISNPNYEAEIRRELQANGLGDLKVLTL